MRIITRIFNRVMHWACFTVSFSFMPLGSIFLISNFFGYVGDNYKYIREILFVCIVISANSLCTLFNDRDYNKHALRDVLIFIAIVTIIFPALLYGGMLLDHNMEINNVYFIPVLLMIASLLCGLTIQIRSEFSV